MRFCKPLLRSINGGNVYYTYNNYRVVLVYVWLENKVIGENKMNKYRIPIIVEQIAYFYVEAKNSEAALEIADNMSAGDIISNLDISDNPELGEILWDEIEDVGEVSKD